MTYEAQLWYWFWLVASVVFGIIVLLTALWLVVRVVSSAWHGSHRTT